MTVDWKNNDELFFRLLEQGHSYEEVVAQRLREYGFDAFCPDKTVRENVSQIHTFSDEVDVAVRKYDGGLLSLEVKSRDIAFTSPDDFPFDDVMVTTVDSWENCKRKPSAFLCVSQRTGAIIVLNSATHPQWEVIKKRDRVRNIMVSSYVASWLLWRELSLFVEGLSIVCPRKGYEIAASGTPEPIVVKPVGVPPNPPPAPSSLSGWINKIRNGSRIYRDAETGFWFSQDMALRIEEDRKGS